LNGLLPRLAVAMLAVGFGIFAGQLLGRLADAPLWGGWIGGVLAVALGGIVDMVRGARLVAWLRTGRTEGSPRDPGFHGELAYRVERALRQRDDALAREQLRLAQFLDAIEASPNGVLLLDAHDQIEWCNSVAADHFGLDPQRDRLQPITNLVRAPEFVAHLQSGRLGEAVAVNDLRGTRPRALSVLVRSYGGEMKLVLTQDVTERERAEGMRRDFVANVSHEIRTPLTVLAGFIETMANLPLTEAERRRVLVLMEQQSARMQALVADLLTLAQLEGSPRPLADRWVDLAGLLLQVEADARALSGGRHVLSFEPGVPTQVAGAQPELVSAVANLVNNAIRYTPEGGRIAVSWRVREDGCGELAVVDTGPGIAREHLPRLTERFYRVDGSRSRETGGTGLGLAIVKHVVQRHGGTLEIDSEVGKGSVFRLVLPAVRLRVAAAEPVDAH
jgi:two-component system, OmpR family, phosphate regulon sensor histidine kinase PhoR